MKILVTGGTGFIGSHLVRRLLGLSYSVTILARKKSDVWRIADIIDNEQLQILYLEELSLQKLFDDNLFDAVIHLAAYYIKNNETEEDVTALQNSNIVWPTSLVNYARKHVPLFINTGTCFEYAQKTTKLTEKDTIEPYNYYAVSKIAFELFLKHTTQTSPLRAVTLKLFYPYGEMDNAKVIPLMIGSMLTNKPLTLTQSSQTFSYTYVEDIVDAYIRVLTKKTNSKFEKYTIYNIGAEKGVSLREIYLVLNKLNDNKKNDIHFTGLSIPNDLITMLCDGSKAKEELDFEAKTSIETGLKKTYNFYKEHFSFLPL